MISTNPHFNNRRYSAYELANLLRELPDGADANSAETRLKLEAAERHADNYGEIMLEGLEALGHVMFSAAENEAWPVDQHDVARLGEMISQISGQLTFINEFRDSVRHSLDEADKKGRK